MEIRKLFVEMENIARKFELQINQEKTKCMIVERKNSLKQNKIGHLKIKNYKFERVENFKYLGVILNEITITKETCKKTKNANKHISCYKKHIKETKMKNKEHNNRQNINICIRNLETNKER
jgi:hypothetical protein